VERSHRGAQHAVIEEDIAVHQQAVLRDAVSVNPPPELIEHNVVPNHLGSRRVLNVNPMTVALVGHGVLRSAVVDDVSIEFRIDGLLPESKTHSRVVNYQVNELRVWP